MKLWLALHFPLLPLEALSLRQPPSAIVSQGRILVADDAAVLAGILPGQKRSTALGLVPALRLYERLPQRETEALDALACWAGQFTPTVSLAAPMTVLLEIGGCLRLFGGLAALVQAVLAGCSEQGWTVRWAVAPTPLAARWLAQEGAASAVEAQEALRLALAELSCSVPAWGAKIQARLESFGLARLGDLLAQPAASLRRRIGDGPVDDLLRALGDLPDPQQAFVFPERFAAGLELPSRVEFAEGLAFAAQRLLAALAGWLQVRQLLLQSCTLRLSHDDGAVTELPLRFGEACADEARFMRLLREHLNRLTLISPVEALHLATDQVISRPAASECLFDQAAAGEGAAACIERLRARLGDAAVHGVKANPDYRPECAMQASHQESIFADKGVSTAKFPVQRPLWLLPQPKALPEQREGPNWHGTLQLLTRGERLESGWWDAGEANATGDIRRDYFIARNPRGQWVWIFRDRQGWFLHGVFA